MEGGQGLQGPSFICIPGGLLSKVAWTLGVAGTASCMPADWNRCVSFWALWRYTLLSAPPSSEGSDVPLIPTEQRVTTCLAVLAPGIFGGDSHGWVMFCVFVVNFGASQAGATCGCYMADVTD